FSDVRSGAFSTELGCPRHVRSSPVSDRIADIPDRQLRANFGSEHIHSITSSAWASNVAGTVRPRALAATAPLSAGHWKRRHEQYEDAAALAPLELRLIKCNALFLFLT